MASEPKCDLCGDNGPVHIHSRCHMTAPLQVSIESGMIILRCYVPDCAREVARYRLALEEK